jgi:hypothetical protein
LSAKQGDYRLNQPAKNQPQIFTSQRRCAHKANRLSWCKKQQRLCNAPAEYESCTSYTPRQVRQKHPLSRTKQQNNEQTTASPHTLLIGVKTGQCDICKVTKKILLLRFGFSLCEECLSVCTTILDQLELNDAERPKEKHQTAETAPKTSGP